MKIRNLFILCFTLMSFFITPLFAKNIDVTQAKQVATNFYTEQYNYYFKTSIKSVSVSETYEIKVHSATVFYIFNMANNGFIMVSASDIVNPVLGFSFEGMYNNQDLPPQFNDVINNYKKQITLDVAAELSPTPQITAEWERLNKTPNDFSSSKSIVFHIVEPLTTSVWSQGCCYNALCPYDVAATSSCSRCVTGCTATAFAQILYYYRYPLQGQGSHTDSNTNYGTLSVDFGASNYNWNAMTDACMDTDKAIATLIYDCGIAVDMDYGPNGSGAYPAANNAFVTFFNYDPAIQNISKSNYTDAKWDSILISELNVGRPMLYSGWDNPIGEGHAFVCDGYMGTSYFHFNWGWSGQDNGFFYMDALNPGGYEFNDGDQVLYKIYPPSSAYPYYCTGLTTLIADAGSFNDGSGYMDYQNNDDCSWLIAPNDVISHLRLTFDYFNTADSNDVVTIYDGPNASAPVLGRYYGSAVPPVINSTATSVFITFKTDSAHTSSGWQISYTSILPVYCSGVETHTALTDTISDGSGIYKYQNNVNCKWLIAPSGAATVKLHFLNFRTEPVYDVVKVIDPVNGTTLAEYSGTTIPVDVISYSGQMLIQFTTNSSVTDSGWTAIYTSSLAGIEDYNTIKDLSVYPNPAKDNIHISFSFEGSANATIEIIDITGQIIYSQNITTSTGAFSKNIDMTDYAKGIYNLHIVTSKEAINKKIVLE